MLELVNIKKRYVIADTYTDALKGVSISFRENEFVAILGPSGCGKTTLLNIIGGLDKATSGDLIINGKSTKNFTDHDFDSYRNNYIGFVFQSYNLIAHQSVLANVELSLTLSGVSKQERIKRAKEALIKVGLEEQIYKKPNQLSGGQMQRVAIARAIVNNPKIILADEPTGALDTTTSVQIMDILKEISKECLIIMVTHNPDLANQYATRTINLLNGEVVNDNNPLNKEELKQLETEKVIEKNKSPKDRKTKKIGMNIFTAISLSFKNLLTKKARTILTAFAGSIGIIGIALILSLSNGFQKYIDNIEKDTLSSYPLSITQSNTDLSGLTDLYSNMSKNEEVKRDEDKVYSNDVMSGFLSSKAFEIRQNDLSAFKKYLDEHREDLDESITDIEYVYDIDFNIYSTSYSLLDNSAPTKLNPFSFNSNDLYLRMLENLINNSSTWSQMIGSEEFVKSQYTLKAGYWPTKYDEVVLVLDDKGGINDYYLYALGIKEQSDLEELLNEKAENGKIESKNESFSYETFLNRTYKLVLNCDYFIKEEDSYRYTSESIVEKTEAKDYSEIKNIIDSKGIDLKITGIIQANKEAGGVGAGGVISYTKELTNYCTNYIENSQVIIDQLASETNLVKNINNGTFNAFFTKDSLLNNYMGIVNKDNPSSINIYSKSFEGKDAVKKFIEDYNKNVTDDSKKISYSDYVGLLMSSISTIINAISYVLIAFVSISLIVSSIMIAIITYISVLERTKEIGVLRSIGASKRDIKRVFNAETLIIGTISGVLGVIITVVLDIPINIIIDNLAHIGHIAYLPILAAIILILISIFLTLLSGLIPASIAAKRDPVVALRTE